MGALVGRFAERRKARIQFFRASARGFRERGPMTVERAVDRGAVTVERRSEAGTVGLEQLRHLLGVFADAALEVDPVGVETLADVLQRRDDLVLELLDARAERTRRGLDLASQRRVDRVGEAGQRLGQRSDALLQRLADFGRLRVQAAHQLASAFAERPCGFERIAGERFRNRAAALRKAVVDPPDQGFERAGDLLELARGPFVERLEPRFERRRGLFGAAAELLVERAAACDQHVLDRAELEAEIVGQRVRAVADLRHKFSAAPVDRAFESREAVSERYFDATGVRSERRVDGIEVRRRDGFELPEPLGGFGRKVFEMGVEAVAEVLAVAAHHRVDRPDVAGDVRVQFVRVGGDAVDHAVPVLADQIVERFQIFPHAAGLVGQGFDQASAALADNRIERRHLRAQRVVHAACADRDGCGGVVRQRSETLADLRGFGIEPVER